MQRLGLWNQRRARTQDQGYQCAVFTPQHLGKDTSSPELIRNLTFFPSSVSGKTYIFEYSKCGPVLLNKHLKNRSHWAKAFAKRAPTPCGRANSTSSLATRRTIKSWSRGLNQRSPGRLHPCYGCGSSWRWDVVGSHVV